MFRIVTGVTVLVLAGFCAYGIFASSYIFIIHTALLTGIGIAILFNRHEDDIEEINNSK